MSLSDISAEMEERLIANPIPVSAEMQKMLLELVDYEEFVNFAEERLMNYAQSNSFLFSGDVVPTSTDARIMRMMSTIAAEFFYIGARYEQAKQAAQPST